jgi:hypothetical protein
LSIEETVMVIAKWTVSGGLFPVLSQLEVVLVGSLDIAELFDV